ncbi:MAG: DUF4167 domain-containing protein, partial [Planktomarina sp.]
QQHAEHYMRMLSVAQAEADARREQHDKENREKQAQRDQERAERQEREAAAAGSEAAAAGSEAVQQAPDMADSPQPDVAPLGDAAPSDLVETPEAAAETKPKPRRKRTPKPKNNPLTEGTDQPPVSDAD